MDNNETSAPAKESYGYDYRTVETEMKFAPETLDCYESFGWELKERSENVLRRSTFSFRRSRRVNNRDRVNRLQMRMEDSLSGIRVMERQKTSAANTISLIIGIIGALFFGGGMSLFIIEFEHELWHYIVGGILAAVGVGICLLAYYAYLKIRAKRTRELNEQIEKKRDEIAAVCEDAQKLLSGSN